MRFYVWLAGISLTLFISGTLLKRHFGDGCWQTDHLRHVNGQIAIAVLLVIIVRQAVVFFTLKTKHTMPRLDS